MRHYPNLNIPSREIKIIDEDKWLLKGYLETTGTKSLFPNRSHGGIEINKYQKYAVLGFNDERESLRIPHFEQEFFINKTIYSLVPYSGKKETYDIVYSDDYDSTYKYLDVKIDDEEYHYHSRMLKRPLFKKIFKLKNNTFIAIIEKNNNVYLLESQDLREWKKFFTFVADEFFLISDSIKLINDKFCMLLRNKMKKYLLYVFGNERVMSQVNRIP